MAADGDPRLLSLDRLAGSRGCPRWSPCAADVAVAARRASGGPAVAPSGQSCELLGRLVLVEVEAPVPGRDRDAGAEAEERRPPRSRSRLHRAEPCAGSSSRRTPRAARPRSRCCRGPARCGVSIAPSASIVSSRPSWTEAKSPAPTTRSASLDLSTRSAQASRSRWRSLKARTLIREPLRAQSSSMRRARASVSSSSSVSVTTLSRPRRAVRASITSSTSTSRPSSAATLPEVAGSQSSSSAS